MRVSNRQVRRGKSTGMWGRGLTYTFSVTMSTQKHAGREHVLIFPASNSCQVLS